jgi:hypothetical protein
MPLDEQLAQETEIKRRLAISPTAGAEMVEKQLEARTKAIQDGLRDNPIATTIDNFPDKFKDKLEPLNTSDPQQFLTGLAKRAQIAQIGANNWHVPPLSALDDHEVQTVKAALTNPDPAVKAHIYSGLATLPEDVRGATLRKLGGNSPREIAEAAAGSLMATAPDIAASIFRGNAAIKTDKRYDPEDEGTGSKQTYYADLDKAMPASVFTLQDRTDPNGAYAAMVNMVKARYADLGAQSPSGTTYSSDRLRQAVTDVTGGILTHNGGSIIAPSRGMSQGQFDGVIEGISGGDLADVRTLSGTPVTPDYVKRQAQLESVGDGKYFVRLGRDPTTPTYAYRGNQKFVLDLRGWNPLAVPQPEYAPGP